MRQARKFKRPASGFRKGLIRFTLVLMAVVAAALILPGYIDWNRFKDEIEHQASAITGRQVRIAGAISFKMLPRPALSLENATLANAVGATEPVMLGLERLEAQLGMMALLSGKIQVANFRLIAPVLNLETLPDGTHNWAWQPGSSDGASTIRFDNVEVERGTLRYRNHVSGDAFEVAAMQLQLSADTLQGPFEAKGSVRLRDMPINIEAALGKFIPARGAPLNVKLILADGVKVNFTGTTTDTGAANGVLNSQGTDFNELIAAISKLGVPVLSGVQHEYLRHPYRMEASIAAGSDAMKFDRVKLGLGENTLTGSLLLNTGATKGFEVNLNASSLDLDALRTTAPVAVAARPATENSFDIPHDISGTVRFSGNAIKLNNAHLRDVTLAMTVADGAANLDAFSALLPGSASSQISGKLTAVKGQPQFSGKIALRAENLRGLLGWFGYQFPEMQERSLSRAELSGLLELSPELLQLNEISAEIDASRLTGSIGLGIRERLALGVDLDVDQLNADNYFQEENETVPDVPSTDNSAPVIVPDSGLSWVLLRDLVARYDSNFNISVRALTYRGVPITKLKADGAAIGGTLALNSFSVSDIAGTAISISGVLGNFATATQGEINLRLASNDLAGFARTLGVTLPVPGKQLGKSSIEAKFLLANAGLETVIESRFGETIFQMSGGMSGLAPGTLALVGDQTTFKAYLSLANPSLAKFSTQTGLDIFPSAPEDAAGIAMTAELSGTRTEIGLSALQGVIGTITVHGMANWNSKAAKPMVRAELKFGEILADNYLQPLPLQNADEPATRRQLPWSGAPFDMTWMAQFDADINIEAERFFARGYDIARPGIIFEIREGNARLKQFSGKLFDGELGATANLKFDMPVPELTAEWKLKSADMKAASVALAGAEAMTGRMDFSGAVKGAGVSSFALVSSLEGQARITATDGFIQGIDLPTFSSRLGSMERAADFMNLADTILRGGNTPFKRISLPFVISQGVAQSKNPEINIDSATGGVDVSIDLPRYWLNSEASLTLNQHMNAPPLGIAYIGPLNAPEFSLRTSRLENYFTQGLMSKSLQRIISNRDAQPATASAPAPAISETHAPSLVPSPAAPAPQPVPPAPQEQGTARKMLNGILNGIIKDKK